MMNPVTSLRNTLGLISGNIHSFAVESFIAIPYVAPPDVSAKNTTLSTIFIGFDEINGKTSAELNFSREPQLSYEHGGVLHLFFPSEMMSEIREFLQNTVPVSQSDPSFAVINFEWSGTQDNPDKKFVDPASITLVDRRWCR